MSVELRKIREEDNHVIDTDDFNDDDSYMGDAAQELAIFYEGLNDDLPEAGDSPDEAGLAAQYQAMEISSGPETDKEIIPDNPGDSVRSSRSVSFSEMSEDERAPILRDAARFEASLFPEDEVLECTEPDPVDLIDQDLMDWKDWLFDARYIAEEWDIGQREFDFGEFYDAIHDFALEELKTRDLERMFSAEFDIDESGRDLSRMDYDKWGCFIKDLCVLRLDLRRKDWKAFVQGEKEFFLAHADWGVEYEASGKALEWFRNAAFSQLKSSDLKAIFGAEVSYDSLHDKLWIACDEKRIVEKMDEFIQWHVNPHIPRYLREKEEKARQEAERKAEEEERRREAERVKRERREAEQREREERAFREKAEENAKELVRLREELAGERSARERAEAEVARLLKDMEGLKRGLAEMPQTGKEAERLASEERDAVADRDSEIRRIRHEWSDSDLDMEGVILAMKAELAPLEGELSSLESEMDHLRSIIDHEIRKYCQDNRRSYWTEKELQELPDYREGDVVMPHPALTAWRDLEESFWDKHQQERDEIISVRKPLKKKCEALRAEIEYEEKRREYNEKKYAAQLSRFGASLDPSVLSDASDSGDPCRSEDASVPDFVLHGLPLGKIGCLAGPGGLGKTQIMTQMGLDIACGRNGLVKGGVIHIYGEDDRAAMEQRRKAILANASYSESELADIRANFVPLHLDGVSVDLSDSQSDGSRAFHRKLKLIERDFRRRGVPIRLVVLDTLSNFNGGKENLPEQAAAILEALRRICLETGAALVFVHHLAKGSGSADISADNVRGHSSLINHAKWVKILAPMSEKEAVALGVAPEERMQYVKTVPAKCNYLVSRAPQWFRRDEHGIFVPANFGEPLKASVNAEHARPASLVPKSEPAQGGKSVASPVLLEQPMHEERDAVPAVSAEPDPEASTMTAQLPDSSGNHIGKAAGRPQSGRTGPVLRAGSGRFNRSFGG